MLEWKIGIAKGNQSLDTHFFHFDDVGPHPECKVNRHQKIGVQEYILQVDSLESPTSQTLKSTCYDLRILSR